MYDAGLKNENYLRGVQKADANGQVTFKAVYPAPTTAAGQVFADSRIALAEADCKDVTPCPV